MPAAETGRQAEGFGVTAPHIVPASGTGGTKAGLIAGFAPLGLPIDVIGIDIDADPAGVRNRVTHILRELADEVDLAPGPLEDRIIIESGFSAGSYGQADERTVNAMAIAARLEALTVDPVSS